MRHRPAIALHAPLALFPDEQERPAAIFLERAAVRYALPMRRKREERARAIAGEVLRRPKAGAKIGQRRGMLAHSFRPICDRIGAGEQMRRKILQYHHAILGESSKHGFIARGDEARNLIDEGEHFSVGRVHQTTGSSTKLRPSRSSISTIHRSGSYLIWRSK